REPDREQAAEGDERGAITSRFGGETGLNFHDGRFSPVEWGDEKPRYCGGSGEYVTTGAGAEMQGSDTAERRLSRPELRCQHRCVLVHKLLGLRGRIPPADSGYADRAGVIYFQKGSPAAIPGCVRRRRRSAPDGAVGFA